MDTDKPPERPAYVKRLSPDVEEHINRQSWTTQSSKQLPKLLIDPGIGIIMMTLIGNWIPRRTEDAPDCRAKLSRLSQAYLLSGSDAIISNLGYGLAFNNRDFLELRRKYGPIDQSSPSFQRLKTLIFKDIQIEKAELQRLGGGRVLSVLGYYKGKRILCIIINERLDELSFEASPAEFEKHLPLFQKSLETISPKQYVLNVDVDLWKRKQLEKNSMKPQK
jgi:hypothetical protein